MSNVKAQYYRLEITATSSETEIWLGDHAGFLVHNAVGELGINIMPGEYVVEFGFSTFVYPIHIDHQDRRLTQTKLVSCHASNVGYNRLSLTRALSVVNCQFTLA